MQHSVSVSVCTMPLTSDTPVSTRVMQCKARVTLLGALAAWGAGQQQHPWPQISGRHNHGLGPEHEHEHACHEHRQTGGHRMKSNGWCMAALFEACWGMTVPSSVHSWWPDDQLSNGSPFCSWCCCRSLHQAWTLQASATPAPSLTTCSPCRPIITLQHTLRCTCHTQHLPHTLATTATTCSQAATQPLSTLPTAGLLHSCRRGCSRTALGTRWLRLMLTASMGRPCLASCEWPLTPVLRGWRNGSRQTLGWTRWL